MTSTVSSALSAAVESLWKFRRKGREKWYPVQTITLSMSVRTWPSLRVTPPGLVWSFVGVSKWATSATLDATGGKSSMGRSYGPPLEDWYILLATWDSSRAMSVEETPAPIKRMF